ncbi:MAG: hypothetical protein JRG89_12595 [Deltaproteobacteria bacterium]|nr:hypothetical protein [Deltaproteobacteria bacterium]MBW2389259.1 hypothetical protein [Deltaproteobacteria bacterium]MBW2723338.1 hypothetical protein [Deltaproteobacteria bacterium]
MAQLFSELTPEEARDHQPDVGAPPRWRLTPLEGDQHTLDGAEKVMLFRAADLSGADIWVAMQSPTGTLRVNGVPVATGLRVLAHRDELRMGVGGPLLYFSNEALPRVVAYDPAASDETAHCPRCRRLIEPGTLAVQCPGCRVWHCLTEATPCWTYTPDCALCQHPTDLEGELRWVPGDWPGGE